eukprot:5412773-Amphidinium_carterae.1
MRTDRFLKKNPLACVLPFSITALGTTKSNIGSNCTYPPKRQSRRQQQQQQQQRQQIWTKPSGTHVVLAQLSSGRGSLGAP